MKAIEPATILCLLVAACGAAPTEHVNAAPQAPAPAHPTPSAPAQQPVFTTRALLSGRFQGELSSASQPTNIWPSERAGYRDAWRVPYEGCDLFLAISSEGLARPTELTLGGDQTRSWVPSETAEPRLEVITVPLRPFEVLDGQQAAVGAVVFEADGSATDFFAWPDGPDREGFGDDGEEDWVAWQRGNPALQSCYASAERFLDDMLASLRTQRPFETRSARLPFGWEDSREDSGVFLGALPEGWIITTSDAYDAVFRRVHRRQDWSWSPAEPSPRAEMWTFVGGDERPMPPRGRRETLFGYPLRFDDEGCARVINPRMPFQQYLCLHGSRAEKQELVRVLQTFVRQPTPPQ